MINYLPVAAFLAILLVPWENARGAGSIANETRPRMESRDGNSVDTATGGFIQNLNLLTLQGERTLDFNLGYHSSLYTKKGYAGYGWSSPYEAHIKGDPAGVVTVYLNGNVGNQYRFVAEGQAYLPLNEQNRYDILTRETIAGFEGVFKLRG